MDLRGQWALSNTALPSRRYARAGVPEARVVNLRENAVEIYADPESSGYGSATGVLRGEEVVCTTIEGLSFSAGAALG